MFKIKKNSTLCLELNDYKYSVMIKSGVTEVEWSIIEKYLGTGMIVETSIVEEMELFNLFKKEFSENYKKKQSVRFFVPDTSVLLKTFEHPPSLNPEELLGYVQMELGRTIHLPFQDPLVDVYDPTPNDGQATLFAVPPEEVGKFAGILQDLDLHPEVAEIRALCNLRFLEHINRIDANKTYLIADWSINELSICIYSNGNVEFLRFQSIETDLNKWIANKHNNEVDFTYNGDKQDYLIRITDQVLEIDRISNFFRFSLHKGEKSVDEIVMMGDNPFLHEISELIRENIAISVQIIGDSVVQKHFPQFKAKHASLIGLALKEV